MLTTPSFPPSPRCLLSAAPGSRRPTPSAGRLQPASPCALPTGRRSPLAPSPVPLRARPRTPRERGGQSRALAADKRWGFAGAAVAAAKVAPTRTPESGVLGTPSKSTTLPTRRVAFPWGDRAMPPAPKAWGSSSLLSLKNSGFSDSLGNINDHPSSPGSSTTSTDGSDLVDSPLAWGRTSHNSTIVASRTESTELGSGSWQFPHSQTSFLDALKAPLRTIAKRRPTAHGKGFALSADDFPVLVSKNAQPDRHQGHSFQGRPTYKSVIIAAPEQRKIPITAGGDPVSTSNLHKEARKAQLHAMQTPDICMPPPCIDYWHPPPDHPPDRYGICHGGAASCKPADTPGSFPVQSLTHNGQPLLKPGQEARHSPVNGGYCPENNDICPALVAVDTSMKSLPHLIHGQLKDNSSNGLEKQPVIKKDVALLEKIKCLNIKARSLHAHNMSEISLCRESKVEHPKSIDVLAVHVANDVPCSPVTGDIIYAVDMANSVSESSDHVPVSTLNVSANLIMTDLSEGHVTEFSEAREPCKSADNHVYGAGNASRNRRASSAMDSASDIWEHGWEEHTPIDSLPVTKTNVHEDQPFTENSSQKVHVTTANDMLNSRHYEIQSLKSNETPGKSVYYGGGNGSTNWHRSSAEDISFSICGNGWEDHPTVDSFAVMTNIHEDQSFPGNNSHMLHVRTADNIIDSSHCEMQHLRREFSTQNAKLLHEEERGKTQQKAKPIVKLEDLNRRPFVHERTVDDMLNSQGYEIQLSRRELSAQHAKQLHKEAREKIQQKAKANEKLEELNRSWPIKNQKSNDVPLEVDEILCKQGAGRSGTTSHDASIPDTCCDVYAECLNVPLRASDIKNTTVPISYSPELDTAVMSRGALSHSVMLECIIQKIAVQSCDSSAAKHLPADGSEGQIPKQESISMVSIASSETADATKGPSVLNVISSAKKSDNMMERIKQNEASQSNDNGAQMHLQLEDKGRQVRSQGRTLRGYTRALGSGGFNKSPLIHNIMPSAKNTNINTVENIAWKSASQLHQKSAAKHLQMENRQRQARTQERVLKERSNIAESKENITTVAVTHMDAQNTEAKSHVDLSTHSKKGRPVSPCTFGTENTVTEASGVHKSHISGVVINSSIIPVQAASVRGFTVGSIMLGDGSLASLNQNEKTVSEKVHDYTTCSRASPKQTKQSRKNQYAKDPHGSDNIMCTQVNESCKKEQFEAGGLNCLVITVPTQPPGSERICPQNVVTETTSEMDSHALKPTYKELHLQNLVKMLPAEQHATPCDNSSTSKVESKSNDKEAVNPSTTAKDEANTEPENRVDKKAIMHIGRSTAFLNQETTNESASVGQYLSEQETSSLVFKIMQELSDQLDQVEKQLESSTHVPTLNHSQSTQMVSLPGYTWGEHRTSQSQRQYHVGGQGNMWINYSANSQMDVVGMTPGTTAPPTSHVLFPVPQNNMLDVNRTLGWTWDAAEGELITDIGSLPDLCTATIERSNCELTENVYSMCQMDLHGMQAGGGMPGMAYVASPMVPEMMYPTGLELEQLSPAWFSQDQHDERYHGGSGGTGMYFLGMEQCAERQTHSGANYMATGPTVVAGHPEYQLIPVASPGAAYTGGTMVSAGDPAACAWGVAYGEHVDYAWWPDSSSSSR